MESVIKQLDSSVVKILCSAQVITSPSSVIKELVENALDAEATNIDVKLESFGLDRIEVRDNGAGVSPEDAKRMAVSHNTSKLRGYDDLQHVTTYGFRGEALSSIASLGDLTIATKKGDAVGVSYKYDHSGAVVAQSPVAINQGASVIITKLFKTFPVRRQYYTSTSKKKVEMKNIENLLKAYSIINYEVRFSLYHDRNLIWQKGRSEDVKSSLQQVFGIALLKNLEAIQYTSPDRKIQMSAFLPNRNSAVQLMGHSQPDMTFVFVNKRPVTIKFINQVLKKGYSAANVLLGSKMKNPVSCLSIKVPTETIDVNIDPSKSQVFFHAKEEVKQALNSLLANMYDLPEKSTTCLNTQLTNLIQNPSEDQSVSVEPPVVNINKSHYNTPAKLSTLLDDEMETGWEIMMDDIEVYDNIGIKNKKGLQRTQNVEIKNQFTSTNFSGSNLDSTKSKNLISSQWSKGCIRDSMGEIIKPPQILLGKEKTCSNNALPVLEIIDCQRKKKPKLDISANLTMDNFLECSAQNVNQATQSSPERVANRGGQPAKVVQPKTARKERKRVIAGQKLQAICDKRPNKITFFQKVRQDNLIAAGVEKSEPIKSVVMQFNVDKVKSSMLLSQCSSFSSTSDGNEIHIVGELDNGFWTILQENELKILNHHRLSETLLYQRLMENHDIAKQRLEQPIVLNENNLGEKEWHVLIKLAVSNMRLDDMLLAVDDRIFKNGFGIKTYEDTGGSDTISLSLVEVASCIPFYGLVELKECLTNIVSNRNATLSESRPMKAVNYLKGEAVRMARAMPNHKSKDDLFTMLRNAKENLPQDLNRCCHGRPFFTTVYNLENIPEVKEDDY